MEETEKFWGKMQEVRRKEATSIGRTLIIALIVSILVVPLFILFLDENSSFAIYFLAMTANLIWLIRDLLGFEESIGDLKERIEETNLDNSP
ncbi:MAG: hypothetical protein COT15_05065 [Candidatus Diapherotrites archaeon CG08_land_8_20_14_0_20_34_12]|nr:MAG: hypothetical protein COT15_05065 [Candidatus Diapherotrites archaeon CG08_land_8_20_14_0_20_34_12]